MWTIEQNWSQWCHIFLTIYDLSCAAQVGNPLPGYSTHIMIGTISSPSSTVTSSLTITRFLSRRLQPWRSGRLRGTPRKESAPCLIIAVEINRPRGQWDREFVPRRHPGTGNGPGSGRSIRTRSLGKRKRKSGIYNLLANWWAVGGVGETGTPVIFVWQRRCFFAAIAYNTRACLLVNIWMWYTPCIDTGAFPLVNV